MLQNLVDHRDQVENDLTVLGDKGITLPPQHGLDLGVYETVGVRPKLRESIRRDDLVDAILDESLDRVRDRRGKDLSALRQGVGGHGLWIQDGDDFSADPL